MENVLIVSGTEKGMTFFREMLSQNIYQEIVTLTNAGEARRLLIERDFDLCIINTPLPDEFGDKLARNVVSRGLSQAILVVKSELYDEIAARVEDAGIFAISKPLNKQMFWTALKLANAAFNKMSMLKHENVQLLKKIEDIKIVDRAKYLLIQYLKMTEAEAHRYIEKQAMDMRATKRSIAENILKTYEG